MASPQQMVDLAHYLQIGSGSPQEDDVVSTADVPRLPRQPLAPPARVPPLRFPHELPEPSKYSPFPGVTPFLPKLAGANFE
jgi:hypothetical protein